ncbi:hypothetical protein VPH35_004898 [Triticum aestivum]
MENPVRDVSLRPRMASASVAWSPALAGAERDFEQHAVVATILGNRPRFTVQDVSVAASMQFGVARTRMHVSVFSPGDFLIRFADRSVRDTALSSPLILLIGGAALRLAAWSRRAGATLIKLPFKARVCLEGPPWHAWTVEDIKQLFPAPAKVDHIEDGVFFDEESACCCAWVWVQDATKIATRGTLTVEEPANQSSPEFHRQFLDGSPGRQATSSSDPVKMLAYPVLIHLDRVYDYTVQPASSDENLRSYNSNISGLPSESSSSQDRCIKWHYRWNLYYEDGTFPPRRGPVHSRLNFRGGGGFEDPSGGDAADPNHRRHIGRDGGHRKRGGVDGASSSSAMHGRNGDPQIFRRRQATVFEANGGTSSGSEPATAAKPVEIRICDKDAEDQLALVGPNPPMEAPLTKVLADNPTEETLALDLVLSEVHQRPASFLMSPGELQAEGGQGVQIMGEMRSEDELCMQDADPLSPPLHAPLHGKDIVDVAPHGHALSVGATLGMAEREGGPPTLLLGPSNDGPGMGLLTGPMLDLATPLRGPSPRHPAQDATPLGPLSSLPSSSVGDQDSSSNIQIDTFLNNCSAPIPDPLLPSPVPLLHKPHVSDRPPATGSTRSSGRIAAKPTRQLSSMDKTLHVLKKEGIAAATDTEEDVMDKLKNICKKPLPSGFIAAVSSLISASGPPQGGALRVPSLPGIESA